jgi:hypothetical protein
MASPRTAVSFFLVAALAACSEPLAEPGPSTAPEIPALAVRPTPPPGLAETAPPPVSLPQSGGAVTLVESFDDPFIGWKSRFMGLFSNLQNYYVAMGYSQDENYRGNNLDGLWIHDGDLDSNDSYIRFAPTFAASLTSFAIDIGAHNPVTLTVYDKDLAVLASWPVPIGCSNCQYFGGSNIYYGFSVASSNGIGGFDINAAEGGVGIDNIIVTKAPNVAPVADAGPDRVVECTDASVGATFVSLDGTGSSDPDGSIVSYAWSTGGVTVSTDPAFTLPLELGSHTVTLEVMDDQAALDSDDAAIDVVDTAPPLIDLALATTELWPANHKMITVATRISASDACDAWPRLHVSVVSDEPVEGTGDGVASPDWIITAYPDRTYAVQLRAERSGEGHGRTYTITARAVDAAGHATTAQVQVRVPHDKGSGGT